MKVTYFCDTGLPTVILTPSSQTVEVTFTAKFNTIVSGVGSEDFTYQWFHNGTIISDENGRSLVITNVTESKSGKYECIVSNYYNNTAISEAATLTVTSK